MGGCKEHELPTGLFCPTSLFFNTWCGACGSLLLWRFKRCNNSAGLCLMLLALHNSCQHICNPSLPSHCARAKAIYTPCVSSKCSPCHFNTSPSLRPPSLLHSLPLPSPLVPLTHYSGLIDQQDRPETYNAIPCPSIQGVCLL